MIEIEPWIIQSNLIEGVEDITEHTRSQGAWSRFRKQELTIKNILAVHKRIMIEHLPDEAGKFRQCRVWVGGHEGKPWPEIPQLMEGWLALWHNIVKECAHTPECVDRLTRMAHVEFEKIHPFVDGNGRTGRMVMQWQRVNHGLSALNILDAEKGAYYDWFR